MFIKTQGYLSKPVRYLNTFTGFEFTTFGMEMSIRKLANYCLCMLGKHIQFRHYTMLISQMIWAKPRKQILLRQDFSSSVRQQIQNILPNPPKKLWRCPLSFLDVSYFLPAFFFFLLIYKNIHLLHPPSPKNLLNVKLTFICFSCHYLKA